MRQSASEATTAGENWPVAVLLRPKGWKKYDDPTSPLGTAIYATPVEQLTRGWFADFLEGAC